MKSIFTLFIYTFILHFSASSQTEDMTAKDVLSQHFEAIGGKKHWKSLESRKAEEIITTYTGRTEAVDQILYFKNFYKNPGKYLKTWTESIFYNLIVFTPDCSWFYFDERQSVQFYPNGIIKDKKWPQIEAVKIVNFPMIDSLIIENSLYRIDFWEEKWNRILSVYFDPHTFLINKHSYVNPGETALHEYYYSDYREKDGYVEPYLIDNYVDGVKFKSSEMTSIEYNIDIDETIFDPPVPCQKDEKLSIVNLEQPLPYKYN